MNNKIYAVNFATKSFKKIQKLNTESALKFGKVNKVFSYNEDSLKEFISLNSKIFSIKKGFGLWSWKPYIILDVLNKIDFDNYIIYSDSGSIFINPVEDLIKSLNKSNQDLMFFELPFIERQFTKIELFDYFSCNNEYFKNSNQINASFFVLKKTKESLIFFRELYNSCSLSNLSDDFNPTIQLFDFKEHRHDQSVLSLLAKTHKLSFFRDPSQYGSFPSDYLYSKTLFRINSYQNSNYKTIFIHSRLRNPFLMKFIFFIKIFLYRFFKLVRFSLLDFRKIL